MGKRLYFITSRNANAFVITGFFFFFLEARRNLLHHVSSVTGTTCARTSSANVAVTPLSKWVKTVVAKPSLLYNHVGTSGTPQPIASVPNMQAIGATPFANLNASLG